MGFDCIFPFIVHRSFISFTRHLMEVNSCTSDCQPMKTMKLFQAIYQIISSSFSPKDPSQAITLFVLLFTENEPQISMFVRFCKGYMCSASIPFWIGWDRQRKRMSFAGRCFICYLSIILMHSGTISRCGRCLLALFLSLKWNPVALACRRFGKH